MGHVVLERIAIGAVLIDELERQFHLNGGNLVERVNLRVVHNGQVEAVIYRLFHKHAVEHAPCIRIQAKRYIADAQNGLDLGQLLLDLPDGL